MSKNNSFFVDVSPEMQIYRILQKQSYGEESALSEFIDNSIQSFNESEELIKKVDDENTPLKVTISIDTTKGTIVIVDNAAGINRNDFQKAIKMGFQSHAKNSLSMYGMGMKSSAIWFSDIWQIETVNINSKEKLTLFFNLNTLLNNNSSEINVQSEKATKNEHYTKITIFNHNRNTSEDYYSRKVLPFLLETFCKFSNINIEIIHDGLLLQPKLGVRKKPFLNIPTPLYAPKYGNDNLPIDNNNISWKKEIDFKYQGKHVYGFVMIIATGSYSQPGIRLIRNHRIIQGTSIQPNLPNAITGTMNKFGAQRIYGEIHLNDFSVNYQKTGFDEALDGVYKEIKKILDEVPSLIRQASNYRKNPKNKKKSSEDKTSQNPTRPTLTTDPTKIPKSQKIYKKLKQIDNKKLIRLYDSLCKVSLIEHAILVYVGTWVFFETISTAMGKKDGIAFDAFFNQKINAMYTKDKNKKRDIKAHIKDIQTKGNCNKHSATSRVINAQQLSNDFEELEEFIIYCLDISDKN